MIKFAAAFALLVLLAGHAQARPRDEAMGRAYRCASQPQTRVWLDCYYGAAQPVRAALGMPPAPPAQVALSDAPPLAGQPADIGARDAVMAQAARCADVPGDRPWLDCFYAASNPVRGVLALPLMAAPAILAQQAVTPGPAHAPAPFRAPKRRTGFFASFLGDGAIEAQGRMASYSVGPGQLFTVTLENGQVWRQIEGDTAQAHWTKPAPRYLVTITGGAFGSHNLKVKDMPGMFKVTRVS